MPPGETLSLPTSEARAKLSEIIMRVQDPRAACILTRHGKPVAAVVSMAELKRIWAEQDIEDIVEHRQSPGLFLLGPHSLKARTPHEAAEKIRRIQLDRRIEREVLENAGMEPVEGGELRLEAEVPAAVTRRRWWQVWRR